jgi:hypothetical protein
MHGVMPEMRRTRRLRIMTSKRSSLCPGIGEQRLAGRVWLSHEAVFPEVARQIVKGKINVRAWTVAKENLHEFLNLTDWLKRKEIGL